MVYASFLQGAMGKSMRSPSQLIASTPFVNVRFSDEQKSLRVVISQHVTCVKQCTGGGREREKGGGREGASPTLLT